MTSGETSGAGHCERDRKSTRLNSSHLVISYAVFCLKKKNVTKMIDVRNFTLMQSDQCIDNILRKERVSLHRHLSNSIAHAVNNRNSHPHRLVLRSS